LYALMAVGRMLKLRLYGEVTAKGTGELEGARVVSE
jgi:hypothetical protein